MHGSFTPDSAEKFLELMREAGYETSALPTSDGLQNFSELGINPGAVQGDVWSGNVANFGEVRGEYIENYDYTRCVRPNGTAYGTSGKCKKGTESDAYMPVHQHDKLKKSDSLFSIPQHTPLERALGKLQELERRIKDPNYSPTDLELERYGKLKNAVEGIQNKKEKKDRLIKVPRKSIMSLKSSLEKLTDNKSSSKRDFKDSLERTKEEIDRLKKELNPLKRFFDDKDWVNAEKRSLSMLEKSYEKALKVYEGRHEFSEEEEIHDYTRCVRPNGTAYGTGGTCRKGTPAEKEEHDALSQLQQMLPKGEKIVTSSGDIFGKESKASSKSSDEIATAPVPPKPIKDPVPGILRSQAEVKKIIADRPEAPNAIRDEMGRPLKLSSERLRALSQEELETEWNRAKTTSRKGSLRKEIDRREAEGKLGKSKADLLETSNKIDEIVKSGGRVGLNDPLSKKLREQAAAIAAMKKANS